jgi:hypothetical protein
MPPWVTAVAESILVPQIQVGCYGKPKGTPIAALLHHVTVDLDTFLGMPLEPSLWDLACTHPHLLAAILALSACHLRHHSPDPYQHRIAEFSFESIALRMFQITLPDPLDQQRSDALLLTSMMLNTLTFAFVDDAACSTSWVSSDQADRLGWLSLQLGLKPLLLATKPFHERSILQPIFIASDDEHKTFSAEGVSADRVPEVWLKVLCGKAWGQNICGEKPKGEDALGQYLHEPTRILSEIRRLQPSGENVLLFVQFVRKLDYEFLAMLFDRDERALWVMGYWLGLLGRLDMWWSKLRVARDWMAIRNFLLEKGVCRRKGEYGRMWRQLMNDYDAVRDLDKAQSLEQ